MTKGVTECVASLPSYLQLRVDQNAVELCGRERQALLVRAVHHEDDALRPGEVVAPVWPQRVLAAYVLLGGGTTQSVTTRA